MEIEDRGNAVKIGDHIIPAVNIQVEGVPGHIKCDIPGCAGHWYGIYFEIMMEQGDLWEVSYRDQEHSDDQIYVTVFPNWGMSQDFTDVKKLEVYPFNDWDMFLFFYNTMRKARFYEYKNSNYMPGLVNFT